MAGSLWVWGRKSIADGPPAAGANGGFHVGAGPEASHARPRGAAANPPARSIGAGLDDRARPARCFARRLPVRLSRPAGRRAAPHRRSGTITSTRAGELRELDSLDLA